MSKFKDSVVTEQGKALLFGDAKIIYTKAVLFSQDLSNTAVEDIRKLTSLSGKLFETSIGINKRGSGTVNIEASFSNKDLTDDIDFNTVGWYAKPDGRDEILVSISPTDGTQTLGAMTPGQQATDAIDLVLATAVGDSSKVDVVIDPAGQVTAAKLNSVINDLTVEFNQEITDAAKVKDFPTDVKSFNNLPDGYYHFSNLSRKDAVALFSDVRSNGGIWNGNVQKHGLIRTITISDDNKIQFLKGSPYGYFSYRFKTSGKWSSWYVVATKGDIDDLSKTITDDYTELSNLIQENKEAADNSINTTVENLTAKIDTKANSSDVSKQVASLNSTISANKADADKKFTDTSATIAANKKDADSKINAANSAITSNKAATDKAIADTNATVTANKKAADDALAIKANAADVSKQIATVNATLNSNKSGTDKSISDLNSAVTANKKDADTKISNLNSTVTANKTATDKAISDANSTIAANKKAADDALATKANTADVSKQIATVNATLNSNKSGTDKSISDLNSAVTANKKDADSKISSLATTVTNNKSATDSAIATKANASNVYTKKQIDGAFATRDSSISSKADKSTTYTKAEVDSAVKSASDTLTTKINSVSGTASNALPKSGGNMVQKSTINWNGGGINDKSGNIGGLNWIGGTDWIHIFGEQNANDNLDYVTDLGDDGSNRVVFRWKGVEKAAINSSGVYTGTVDWSHINGKPDVAINSDMNSKLNNKADKSSVYSITQINQASFQSINTATDINTFTTYGKYKMTNTGNTNTPPWISDHRGQLINLNYDGNAKTQIWIPVGSGAKGGDLGWRYWEGSTAPSWERISSYAELQNVQNTLQSKLDATNKNVTTAQSTANSATTKANNAQSTANTANSTANAAKTAATNAQSTANAANSTASSAKTTATSAQNTANSVNSKVNVDVPLFSQSPSQASIFQTSRRALQAIRWEGTADQGYCAGSYGAAVAFGGNDTKGILSVGYGSHDAKITGGNKSSQWTESVAWKSQVSDLQNQINQIKSTVPVVQTFTDESQAKTWINAGGSQVRIALIE